MINYVWGALVLGGTLAALLSGQPDVVTQALTDGALRGVELGVRMLGAIMLWTGLIRIADDAGLTRWLARALEPLARRLFPSVPGDSPAMGALLMAISANVLGLGNAATPLGIKAMSELQRLNPEPRRASPAMCTLLALSTSSVTVVPTGVIALRAAAGASQPADILVPTLIATTYSTLVALVADAYFRSRSLRR
ncbi:MAG: spore maturation protein [Limnochordaceae bacterium]|uniref:Nucleoside recognition domain-containing protein n=1 Tax=Carboxydichorda subterranea TaxID=3109565 RepID=A0ABZ1BXZ3_9FIRM|nr:nucleoside recognition domain-containing protein [Limnochorda sp. L945t]MBE3599073.1 spore maturation protein [Limnochordaceae bacterium]WRP17680.1 nucleoside recognition domain-containing protein [Limnochorda sp. L945t]